MNTGKEKSMNAFTDIGQLRIFTKQISEKDEQVVIVVSPWFSYPAEDKALFEELSLKERQIKSIFTNYFSALTFSEIRAKGENLIKEELLQKRSMQEYHMAQAHLQRALSRLKVKSH